MTVAIRLELDWDEVRLRAFQTRAHRQPTPNNPTRHLGPTYFRFFFDRESEKAYKEEKGDRCDALLMSPRW